MLDIIRFFLRHSLVIFGLSVLCGIALYIASSFMTPIYRSEVLLVPVEESFGNTISSVVSGLGGLGRFAGLGDSPTSRKDEALAMLRSRVFVSAFIAANNGFAVMYPNSWDAEAGDWKVSMDAVPSNQDAYILFMSSVMGVSENKNNGTVLVTIDLKDRFVAAQWANDVVSMLNESFQSHVAREAQRSIDYLNRELETASSVELRQVIHRLIEAQIETVMLTKVRDEFVFRVIDPAVVQDKDYYVSPRRMLLTVVGLFIGGFLGLCIVAVRDAMRSGRKVQAEATG